MAIYMVLLPPGTSRVAAREDDLERAVFIKDGFSFAAFFLSLPWLLWQRMWLVCGIFLVVTIALELAAQAAGGPGAGLVSLLVSLLFALEANGLRRWTLERRGWQFVAVVEARNRGEAEQRFFTGMAMDGTQHRMVAGRPAETVQPDPFEAHDPAAPHQAAAQAAPQTTTQTTAHTTAQAPARPAPRISREQVVGLTLTPHRH